MDEEAIGAVCRGGTEGMAAAGDDPVMKVIHEKIDNFDKWTNRIL